MDTIAQVIHECETCCDQASQMWETSACQPCAAPEKQQGFDEKQPWEKEKKLLSCAKVSEENNGELQH